MLMCSLCYDVSCACIQGTNPTLFVKGILGDVFYGTRNITLQSGGGGWKNRPYLGGEIRQAAAGGGSANKSNVEWAPIGGSARRPLSWYRATFDYPRPAAPAVYGSLDNAYADADVTSLLLDAGGLGRGHFFINGRDLGRYYTIQPTNERYYYIPSDVLVAGENVLTIFDETGITNGGLAATRLVFSTMNLPFPGESC